jgi:hypothetical protein
MEEEEGELMGVSEEMEVKLIPQIFQVFIFYCIDLCTKGWEVLPMVLPMEWIFNVIDNYLFFFKEYVAGSSGGGTEGYNQNGNQDVSALPGGSAGGGENYYIKFWKLRGYSSSSNTCKYHYYICKRIHFNGWRKCKI